MSNYKPYPLRFRSGINPTPDSTQQDTVRIVDGNNVRFRDGKAEKIGGHTHATYELHDLNDNVLSVTELSGTPRTILAFEKDYNTWEIVGTSSHLYAKLGSTAYNITPLKTTATTTLATDPFALTSGSKLMTVTYTAHGLAVGDRIEFSGATHGTAGFAATNLNREHIVHTVVNANSFRVYIPNNAPVTDATEGGAAVQIFKQIDAGNADATHATGPGIGVPGQGVPGSIQTDTSLFNQPRIWWADTFGDTLICGDGNGGKCYKWDGSEDTAPAVITNAPTAVDFGWVEDSKLVVVRKNVISNSNVGDYTDWPIAVGSYAYSDTKEDANKLIGRVYVGGENLIFAEENKIFRLKWVGGSVKWFWQQIYTNIGAISPHGCVVVGNVAYLFAKNNFYYYNGGLLQEVPNNTLHDWVFTDINLDQRYKAFLWHNQAFSEIWGHYPSASSTENDRCFIFSTTEGHFSKREDLDRTAADIKGQMLAYPVLASSGSGLFEHESGYNDNGAAMNSWVQTAYKAIADGQYYSEVYGVEPDLVRTGDVDFELYGKTYANDDAGVLLDSKTTSDGTGFLEFLHETRWRSWVIRSNKINGFFKTGKIKEFLARGSEF